MSEERDLIMLNIKLLVRKSLRASKFLFLGTIIICSLFSHVLSNIFHLVSSIEPYPDGNTEPIVQTNEKDTQALPLFHKVTTDNDLQPVVPQNLPFSPEYDLEAKYDSRTPLYTDHVPIKILNDSAFGPTFYNFTGSGTPAQPYLIDGYNITDSSGDLIHIENTTACFRISNNLLNGVYDVYNQHICGIKLVNVTYGLIDGNEITNTGDEAIYLEYSNNTTILNNKIYNCSGSGISLSDANNITMYGNSIYNSSIYGIFLNKSTNDTVIWTNTFQNNNVSNAFDNSTGANFWDNGTHGNWWDDYTGVDPEQDGIGNIPYNISGEAGAQDRYPLMEIYVVITTTPVSLNGTQGIPFFFDFNVSAPYSEILTWFLAGNCTSWLTINDSTGEISGIPSYNSMGTWNVTVSVIDENSASDIYMVFLSVQIVTIFFTEVTSDQNMFLFDIIQLYVRVETDAGKPAEGVAVEWWQGSTFLGSNTTNSTGYSTWTLQLTTAETYHIQAKIPARSLQVNISLPTEAMEFWFNGIDNETEPIQLTIGTNYTISGKLVDSTGDPVSGVEVVFVIDGLTISPISAVIDGWVN
ncbi:MAG: NosD domain-containing protein, partial [Promethearchaeota archaeon]